MSEITPALTAEEWAERTMLDVGIQPRCHDIHVWLEINEFDGSLMTANDNGEQAYNLDVPPERIAGVLALANAALPDSDPRKITRADVEAVRVAAHGLHSAAMEYGGLSEREADADSEVLAAYRVAEKLRALLPP